MSQYLCGKGNVPVPPAHRNYLLCVEIPLMQSVISRVRVEHISKKEVDFLGHQGEVDGFRQGDDH